MTKDSTDLEILVAKIQKQLAPDSEVLHDVKLDGFDSQTKRQIDVLVRQQVGQYKIQIVIDCKDHKKPIDVKGVGEFYTLMTDVRAQKGVLVCPTGFSAAAKTLAKTKQIDENLYVLVVPLVFLPQQKPWLRQSRSICTAQSTRTPTNGGSRSRYLPSVITEPQLSDSVSA